MFRARMLMVVVTLGASSVLADVGAGPEEVGLRAVTGDIVLGRGPGGTHRFAAAWIAILGNGNVAVVYPNPTETEPDGRVPLVAILDREGNILEAARPGLVDDDGLPILERANGHGDDTRGVTIDASQTSNGYAIHSRLQPWKYPGGLAAWGSGETPFANDSGVGAGQVFDADGNATSPVYNAWTDEQIEDAGQVRSRAIAGLSTQTAEGNDLYAFNFWDRKTPAVGTTGDRWAAAGFPEYAGSGNVVGIAIIDSLGNTVLAPTPISPPDDAGGSYATMRGMAAGDGWFACRYVRGDESEPRYAIFQNDGTAVHEIDPVALLVAGGQLEAQAMGWTRGRGDSQLISGRGDYLYAVGTTGGETYIAKFNALAGTLGAWALATDNPGSNQGERMDIHADQSGRVFAVWADWSFGDGAADIEIVGRLFSSDLTPLTPSFAVFENNGANTNGDGLQWKDASCRMDNNLIAVTCHTNGLPDNAEIKTQQAESALEHVVRLIEIVPFVQPDPASAGVEAVSGNIVLGRGNGGSHRFAAAWPDILRNGDVAVVYPNPTETEPDGRVPFVAILDRQGNVLEEARPGLVDDDGLPIIERANGHGDDTRGVTMVASRTSSGYAVHSRLQPWKYPGGLAAWGSGQTPFPNDGGVGSGQVFTSDGDATSPVYNPWTDDQIADAGQVRSRAIAALSETTPEGLDQYAFNFWDRKTPAVGTTGDRWAAAGFPAYAGSGNVVGIAIIDEAGNTILAPTPISPPDDAGGSYATMRGMASGDGWFCCRYVRGDETEPRYAIFSNDGSSIREIDPVPLLVAAGQSQAIAEGWTRGRGDSQLIYGRGAFLYTIGVASSQTYIAKWDALLGTLVAVRQATDNPAGSNQGERMDITADERGNVFAAWADWSFGGAAGDIEIVGRFFDASLAPLGPSFAVFEGAGVNGPGDGLQWKDVSARMDDQIVVVTCHTDALPDNDLLLNPVAESALEHVARILKSPAAVPFYVTRGDCNMDGAMDLTDAVFVLGFAFIGTEAPVCLVTCDFNGDGNLDITNAVYVLNFLFSGGPPPAAPWPNCGIPNENDLSLGCDVEFACQ